MIGSHFPAHLPVVNPPQPIASGTTVSSSSATPPTTNVSPPKVKKYTAEMFRSTFQRVKKEKPELPGNYNEIIRHWNYLAKVGTRVNEKAAQKLYAKMVEENGKLPDDEQRPLEDLYHAAALQSLRTRPAALPDTSGEIIDGLNRLAFHVQVDKAAARKTYVKLCDENDKLPLAEQKDPAQLYYEAAKQHLTVSRSALERFMRLAVSSPRKTAKTVEEKVVRIAKKWTPATVTQQTSGRISENASERSRDYLSLTQISTQYDSSTSGG